MSDEEDDREFDYAVTSHKEDEFYRTQVAQEDEKAEQEKESFSDYLDNTYEQHHGSNCMNKDKTQIIWNEINEKAIQRTFSYVERWLHENQYEDINDYRPHIEKIFQEVFPEKGVKITKMFKRPFGFELHICDGILQIKIPIRHNKYDVSAKILRECSYV